MLSQLSRRFWVLLGVCAALVLLVLALMPAEKTIGQVIKIVYLHGALSRAGQVGFVSGGLAGLAYLVWRRPRLIAWSNALTASGCLFWIAHFIVSIPATHATWGLWLAWSEPRVRMTLQIAGAGLAVLAICWLLQSRLFSAGANALLGLAVAALSDLVGVIRHPLDPIGSSPSPILRLAYLLLLVPVIAAMALTALRLMSSPLVQMGQELAGKASGSTEA